MQNKFLIISGEASGDNYAANIIKEIQKISDNFKIYAIGGNKVRATGATILENSDNLTVVGLVEVIKHLPYISKILKKIKNFIEQEKPDFIILIDFPDFNFRVAKFAKTNSIPVFYFVSPQIWAWRQSRVKFIKEYINKLFVIFPFEEKFYESFDIKVDFVGHPLTEKIKNFTPELNLEKSKFNITILPGSRNSEIKRLLDTMLTVANLLKKNYENIKFFIPVAPTLKFEEIKNIIKRNADFIEVLNGHSYDAINASDLVISASGTATLEAALFGKPVIIVYKINFLSYLLGRLLIKVPYIGMPNLLLGKDYNPELIQYKVKPENIFIEAKKFIENNNKYKTVAEKNASLLNELYKKNSFSYTAKRILELWTNSN